jgi:hypothetical protein
MTKPIAQRDLPCYNKLLKNLRGEKWEEISGSVGYYLVSNYGRVKALPRYVEPKGKSGFWKKERIVNLSIQVHYNELVKRNYYDVRAIFIFQETRFPLGVGRLVYHHFMSPIDFKKDAMMVCHKDDNDLNNRPNNLVLLSCGDKQRLSFSRDRQTSYLKVLDPAIRIKMLKAKTKRVIQCDSRGRKIREFKSINEAAAATNNYPGNISSVARGNLKHLKGTFWKYAKS